MRDILTSKLTDSDGFEKDNKETVLLSTDLVFKLFEKYPQFILLNEILYRHSNSDSIRVTIEELKELISGVR